MEGLVSIMSDNESHKDAVEYTSRLQRTTRTTTSCWNNRGGFYCFFKSQTCKMDFPKSRRALTGYGSRWRAPHNQRDAGKTIAFSENFSILHPSGGNACLSAYEFAPEPCCWSCPPPTMAGPASTTRTSNWTSSSLKRAQEAITIKARNPPIDQFIINKEDK